MGNKIYKIPAKNLSKLQGQIDQINKRVARLIKRGYQVEPVKIEVGPMYPIKIRDEHTDINKEVIFCDVTLISPKTPKVEGWEFVAALTHVDDVGTVLRIVPGAEVAEGELKRFRNASPENCDHCHVRRKRNDTYILRKAAE